MDGFSFVAMCLDVFRAWDATEDTQKEVITYHTLPMGRSGILWERLFAGQSIENMGQSAVVYKSNQPFTYSYRSCC